MSVQTATFIIVILIIALCITAIYWLNASFMTDCMELGSTYEKCERILHSL